MIISVRTIAGRAIYLEVEASDTIELVKRKIQRELGYPPHKQELFIDATGPGTGKWLRYGHTLADYNIQDGSTLRVIICTYRNPCFSPKFIPSLVGAEVCTSRCVLMGVCTMGGHPLMTSWPLKSAMLLYVFVFIFPLLVLVTGIPHVIGERHLRRCRKR